MHHGHHNHVSVVSASVWSDVICTVLFTFIVLMLIRLFYAAVLCALFFLLFLNFKQATLTLMHLGHSTVYFRLDVSRPVLICAVSHAVSCSHRFGLCVGRSN